MSFTTKIPQQSQSDFINARLTSNILRMRIISIYIMAIQILLMILNFFIQPGTDGKYAPLYIILSVACLIIGIVFLILFNSAQRGRFAKQAHKTLLVQSFLYIYVVTQLAFCTLDILSEHGVNSYIIIILILGLVPVISPAQSLASITAAFFYILGVVFFSRNISGMWQTIISTDEWASLLIITGLTATISVIMYRMYVVNYLKSTELRRINDGLEETVRQRTAELELQTEAAHVASRAKSDFLSRMSHEIRTPLNAVVGMTQIAKKSISNAEKALSAIDEISTASAHLLTVINDILDMSKIESGKFEIFTEAFQLKSALLEMSGMILHRCQDKGLDFIHNITEMPEDWVIGDRTRLNQVLINILGNAVKFTNSGGFVSLSIDIVDNNPDILRTSFTIADNGIGMTAEQQARLFSAFDQTDSSVATRFGGTGLGLAISQNLVSMMGGEIVADSAPGVGTSFCFTISFEKTEARETAAAPISTPDFAGKRILLAEDVEINRIIIHELLSETGIAIDNAVNGAQAVEMFCASSEGYYDIVFMDVQMPEMNGYEATMAIRQSLRRDALSIPVIAMTANAYKEDVQNAHNAGMNGHLSKPIDIDAVMRTLATYLGVDQRIQ